MFTPVEAALTGYGRTVTPETPAPEAARKLSDDDVSILVVEDDGVEGVVTDSDFVSMVAETTEAVPVADIMSVPPVTASPMTPLSAVASEISRRGVERVLVVDDGTYWGFVSADSVATHFPTSPFDAERPTPSAAIDATAASVTSD
jgi:CBS domain-containing protein